MHIENKFLFNFAASYSGGGYKRLYEYAKWFNGNGGAWFVVHPLCAGLAGEFPHVRFFVANPSRIERLYNDCGYLGAIGREIGEPALYYSYGIPMYGRFGRVNWFHLSNVLLLGTRGIPLSVIDRVKLGYLGKVARRGFRNADVISAESAHSLALIDAGDRGRLFLSVNGSDDELAALRDGRLLATDDVATVVGTYSYKALADSFRVFQMLRQSGPQLKLQIIGNPKSIPADLRTAPAVIVRGILSRSAVIDCLRRTRFYISTTRVENSYNAAAEGIFLARESYISDLGPHRELLRDMPFDEVSVEGVQRPVLHVRRDGLTGINLKSWDTVIVGMIARFREALRGAGSASASS